MKLKVGQVFKSAIETSWSLYSKEGNYLKAKQTNVLVNDIAIVAKIEGDCRVNLFFPRLNKYGGFPISYIRYFTLSIHETFKQRIKENKE